MEWNLGNQKWTNKILDVRELVNEYSHDICSITEANMDNDTPLNDRVIPGYSI